MGSKKRNASANEESQGKRKGKSTARRGAASRRKTDRPVVKDVSIKSESRHKRTKKMRSENEMPGRPPGPSPEGARPKLEQAGSKKKTHRNCTERSDLLLSPAPTASKTSPKAQAKSEEERSAERAGEKKEEENSEERKRAVEENEVSGLEAEAPHCIPKIQLSAGDILIINEKKFTLKGKLEGDYGRVNMVETEKPSGFWLTFYFESNEAKVKRLKTMSTVSALAAAHGRNHILRILNRGEDKKLGLKFVTTDAILMTLSELLHEKCADAFPHDVALHLCLATFECVEDIHQIGFVHRDVKPAAFAFGREPNAKKIFLTNFGLARRYRRPRDLSHLSRRKRVPFMGSVTYASRGVHQRMERSRKDDLESWFYTCIEFLEGDALPWKKMTDREQILSVKEAFMSAAGFPVATKKFAKITVEFQSIARHIDSLEYRASPDCGSIKKLLGAAMETAKVKPNDVHFTWDWEKIAEDVKKHMESKDEKRNTISPPTKQLTISPTDKEEATDGAGQAVQNCEPTAS
uniref:Protein kinase domain-containing protein n=1 Tax=Steinernema glaseri TaxID=37863 RepID=A0A1I7Y148_9BILA